jgi:glycosyltransferase involved in cell wall biosynthesis
MKLSVIVPVYNGAEFLAEAIASIRTQNYSPLEIIIVDDGSTDGTASLIQSLGNDMRIFHQANSGPSAARNRGLAEATGELISFLDADDIWASDKIKSQIAYLGAHPQVEIVQGLSQPFRVIRKNGDLHHEYLSPVWLCKLDSALFYRRVFDRVGLIDRQRRMGEDLDWFCRARESGLQIAVMNEVSIYYRRHEHNVTSTINQITQANLAVLRKSLQRRRMAETGEITPMTPVLFTPENGNTT